MQLLVDALAVHRLTRLTVEDEITAPLREKIFERWPPDKVKLTEMLTCHWCASIWIGGGAVLARRMVPRAWAPVAEMLAFSSVAGLVEELVN